MLTINVSLPNWMVTRPCTVSNMASPLEDLRITTVNAHNYTVNHKKRDILFLTITLANLNRFL